VRTVRVVYLGSGTFSVPPLRAVLASRHEVAGIITQPSRPAGRGGQVRATPVAEASRQAGREVVECADVNAGDSLERIAALRPDVVAVADFGQLLRRGLLGAAALGAVNVHASLLPELRGAAPINWAIIRGHRRTGVTTFRIVRAMDAGPIYLQQAVEIGAEETAEQLKARLADVGAALLCRTLDLLAAGEAQAQEQDRAKATLAPMLTKADGVIDWTADADAIACRVRGTWPWPGAQAVFCHRQRRLAVTLARAVAAAGAPGVAPGVVDGDLLVSAGRGRVAIRELRPVGKRVMSWRDFVNGYRVETGDRFERA